MVVVGYRVVCLFFCFEGFLRDFFRNYLVISLVFLI